MFREALGKLIVPLSAFAEAAGKSIGRNDRLAEHRSALLGCPSARREGNDRLAETPDEILGDLSSLAETRFALRSSVFSQPCRPFAEQATPGDHSGRPSPCGWALSVESDNAALESASRSAC